MKKETVTIGVIVRDVLFILGLGCSIFLQFTCSQSYIYLSNIILSIFIYMYIIGKIDYLPKCINWIVVIVTVIEICIRGITWMLIPQFLLLSLCIMEIFDVRERLRS